MTCECGNETEGYDMYCKECKEKYEKSMKVFTDSFEDNFSEAEADQREQDEYFSREG